MKDTIYREDAIKTLQENVMFEFTEDEEWAITCLQNLPSADRPQEWIPCSEGLPKRQGFYICTCKDGSKYKRVTFVKWSNGWQLTGSRSYWVVVAWMPLPKPWKGADDE